jgi:hypothetical protein
MQVFDKVADQVQSMGLPVVAVSVTVVPRANTPVLLMLHWHGFARRQAPRSAAAAAPTEPMASIPGFALQLNDRWLALEHLDDAMLQAAWQLGAWDLMRESGALATPRVRPSRMRWNAARPLPSTPLKDRWKTSCWPRRPTAPT